MPTQSKERRYLTRTERRVGAGAALVLFVVALWLVIAPPDRTHVIDGCTPGRHTRCTAEADGDLNAFGGALAALGGAALLVALLGVRFTSIKGPGGWELQSFDDATKGLAPAAPASALAPEAEVEALLPATMQTGSGAPIELEEPLESTDTEMLNQYRRQLYGAHRNVFLTHLLGPPTQPGQSYRVAVFLTGHDEPISTGLVASAVMYFGPSWGSKRFQASWGADGKLGVVTEAFGPFLALCEVTFRDGQRILMHHHIDFEMSVLLNEQRS